MSVGLLPVFEPSHDGLTLNSDGVLLLDVLEGLESLAEKLGIFPLSSFADNRDVPEGFDGDPDELQELLGPWDEWFAIEQGIATFSRLADALDDARHSSGLEEPALVQEELRDYLRCLNAVDPTTTRFRLEVVP